jgi:hypothetical protein
VVECAAFAPVSSYPLIRELTGLGVSQPSNLLDEKADGRIPVWIGPNHQERLSLPALATSLSAYGMLKLVNVYALS